MPWRAVRSLIRVTALSMAGGTSNGASASSQGPDAGPALQPRHPGARIRTASRPDADEALWSILFSYDAHQPWHESRSLYAACFRK